MFYGIDNYFDRLSFDNHLSYIDESYYNYRGYNEDYSHSQLKFGCYILFSISLPIRLSKLHLSLFRTIDLAIQVINESFWIKWNEKKCYLDKIYTTFWPRTNWKKNKGKKSLNLWLQLFLQRSKKLSIPN